MDETSQKIAQKIAELESEYKRHSAYVDSAHRAMKTLRAELKKATLLAAKLEGAIEAYRSAQAEALIPRSDGNGQLPS